MVINGKTLWTAKTPRLEICDYNADGYLLGVGTVDVRWGSQIEPTRALVIVNSKGQLSMLETHRPVNNLPPHGNTYPVILGAHAMGNVGVFRLVPGPGLMEQWWAYSSDTGASLSPVNPTHVIEEGFDSPHVKRMAITCVQPLRAAKMFLVLAAPVGDILGHQGAEEQDEFGGTVFALIGVNGQIIWARESLLWTYYGKPTIEVQRSGSYRVSIKRIGPSSRVMNVLIVQTKEQGTWGIDVAAWD